MFRVVASILGTVDAAVNNEKPEQVPHHQAAPPAKPHTKGDERAALHVVLCELWTERGARNRREYGGADPNTH